MACCQSKRKRRRQKNRPPEDPPQNTQENIDQPEQATVTKTEPPNPKRLQSEEDLYSEIDDKEPGIYVPSSNNSQPLKGILRNPTQTPTPVQSIPNQFTDEIYSDIPSQNPHLHVEPVVHQIPSESEYYKMNNQHFADPNQLMAPINGHMVMGPDGMPMQMDPNMIQHQAAMNYQNTEIQQMMGQPMGQQMGQQMQIDPSMNGSYPFLDDMQQMHLQQQAQMQQAQMLQS